MQYNTVNIVGGIVTLAIISYVLIGIYSYLYARYAIKKGLSKKRFLLSVAVVSLAWVLATLVSVMFASSLGMTLFAVVSFVLIFGASYFLSEKSFGFSGKQKIFYSLALAVIINPTWYFMLV